LDPPSYMQREGKRSVRKCKFGWEYNIRMGVKEIGWTGFFCLRTGGRLLRIIIERLCFMAGGEILVAEKPLASVPRSYVVR